MSNKIVHEILEDLIDHYADHLERGYLSLCQNKPFRLDVSGAKMRHAETVKVVDSTSHTATKYRWLQLSGWVIGDADTRWVGVRIGHQYDETIGRWLGSLGWRPQATVPHPMETAIERVPGWRPPHKACARCPHFVSCELADPL